MTKPIIDKMEIEFDSNNIPYIIKATGRDAQHIIDLLQLELQGKLIISEPEKEI